MMMDGSEARGRLGGKKRFPGRALGPPSAGRRRPMGAGEIQPTPTSSAESQRLEDQPPYLPAAL